MKTPLTLAVIAVVLGAGSAVAQTRYDDGYSTPRAGAGYGYNDRREVPPADRGAPVRGPGSSASGSTDIDRAHGSTGETGTQAGPTTGGGPGSDTAPGLQNDSGG